jgi:hypothetical protein
MARRTSIDEIENSRQQRFRAETMQAVACRSRMTAAAMVKAATSMRDLARGAIAVAREQLARRESGNVR